jgi:FAD dependent monooxygenase
MYRFGFPFAFLPRQRLLHVLHQSFKDTSHIHVDKKVVDIATTEGGAYVFTEDGTIYTGHLVVGADGVHSKVRSEMWRIAHAAIPREEKEGAPARCGSSVCLLYFSFVRS